MHLIKNLRFKKLNSSGIGHHALIAILVISTIAGFGAWRVWQSSAATIESPYQKYIANQDGCVLAGRIWDGTAKTCTPKCRPLAGDWKTVKGSDGNTRGYCSLSVAVSFDTVADAKACIETYHRFFINQVGCARRADQNNVNNAPQCIGYNSSTSAYDNYYAEGTADKCNATKLAVALYSESFDNAVLAKINEYRTNRGIKAVRETNNCLYNYARESAQRMARNNDMTHVTQEALHDARIKCGGVRIAENIAAGITSVNVLGNAWYTSPTHQRNMLDASFDVAAVVTYTSSTGRTYTANWYMAN